MELKDYQHRLYRWHRRKRKANGQPHRGTEEIIGDPLEAIAQDTTKTLYIKQGTAKQFAIVDAGMTDLIRPALYQAYHKIENISSDEPVETYDVVGPICESSDVFGKAVDINKAHRGDLIALRSAGAYGEIMASQYNCRQLPKGYITEDF